MEHENIKGVIFTDKLLTKMQVEGDNLESSELQLQVGSQQDSETYSSVLLTIDPPAELCLNALVELQLKPEQAAKIGTDLLDMAILLGARVPGPGTTIIGLSEMEKELIRKRRNDALTV